MSDSEDLNRVVERLLNDNNVKLKDLVQTVLPRIAGEFRAAGLIEKEVEDAMLVTGVDYFTLAARLVNACQPSLVQNPEEQFPKFLAILKGHETMKPLAAEMESKFEQARESFICNTLFAAH